MARALITGINGFVGVHLASHLEANGYEVYGIVKSKPRVKHHIQADILDYKKIKKVINEIEPDFVFHLAALTSPAQSFINPSETINNNIGGQINILEALKELLMVRTRSLVVSSAEVYGAIDVKDLPIDEKTEMRPASPYGVSKIAQDYLGLQYFLAQNIQSIRVRPFNHIGPQQSPDFVVSAFAKQIAEIEKGKQESIIRVGNLEAKRDFTDVRDIVRAYELLMTKGTAGEVYNIGTGRSYKIQEILDILLSLTDKTIIVEKDQSLIRPLDLPDMVCDPSKIHAETGWKAQIPLETSLKDALDYWRNIV